MCQVINTQVRRANIALDHKLYQARSAVWWVNKNELTVLEVDVNGAVPVITIAEPEINLDLHAKAYVITDEHTTKYIYDLVVHKHKIARIQWQTTNENQGVH